MPLERVTQAPSAQEANPKRQKDPRKVAAGRAGAAARKAKQERILVELRAAKESLHGKESSEGAPQQDDADSTSKTPEPPISLEAASQQGLQDWAPWIIGVVVLTGIYICGAQCRQQVTLPSHDGTSKTVQAEVPSVPPTAKLPCAQQLKVAADPFYME